MREYIIRRTVHTTVIDSVVKNTRLFFLSHHSKSTVKDRFLLVFIDCNKSNGNGIRSLLNVVRLRTVANLDCLDGKGHLTIDHR